MATDEKSERKATPEVYRYKAPWPLYGMNWSQKMKERFRLAVGSFVEEYCNKVRPHPTSTLRRWDDASLALPSKSPCPAPPLLRCKSFSSTKPPSSWKCSARWITLTPPPKSGGFPMMYVPPA